VSRQGAGIRLLGRAHGQFILDAAADSRERREEETRSLLDAIGQARMAQEDTQQ
jgi:hypothetical protein